MRSWVREMQKIEKKRKKIIQNQDYFILTDSSISVEKTPGSLLRLQ